MVQSIVSGLQPGHIQRVPFPHIVVNNALDADYYDQLAADFPTLQQVAGQGRLKNNHAYRLGAEAVIDNPGIARIWREFFAYHTSAPFFAELLGLWGDEIARLHPGLSNNFGKPIEAFSVGRRKPQKSRAAENADTDLVLDCLFGNNSPVRSTSSVRGPHIDSGRKLFSALLYFRHPDDDSSGGALELYSVRGGSYPLRVRKKIPARYVDKVKEIPYAANTLFIWLNSGLSVHGVSPRSVSPLPRRYISFTGECYGGADADFYAHIRSVGAEARGLQRQA